jgi:hypothetical protein
MLDTYVRSLSDGEEMDEMIVEERGSRLLYEDPRDRAIETRKRAGEQPLSSEAHQ